jgi:NADH-quinone oxidoreductase subunit K
MLDYQLLNHSLIIAVVLFALGLVGFVTRWNLVTMLVSSAVMLEGAVLALSAFSTFHAEPSGDLFSVFAIVTIGAQAVVGLSLTIAFVRSDRSLDVSRWNWLGEGRVPNEASEVNAADTTRNVPGGGAIPTATAPSASDGAKRGAGH